MDNVLLFVGLLWTLVTTTLCQWVLPYPLSCTERPVQAVCILRPNSNLSRSDIRGIVVFTQRIACYGYYSLQVQVSITGLQADGNWTYHGLHVHESGDMSNGCESMGRHYNPYGTSHGAQTDPVRLRHVGDFGNVIKDPFGSVQAAVFDNLASLVGQLSILGRGVVLHEGQDDLGRGSNSMSLLTGNSGRRLACCSVEPI